jgi:hypothetical protein
VDRRKDWTKKFPLRVREIDRLYGQSEQKNPSEKKQGCGKAKKDRLMQW